MGKGRNKQQSGILEKTMDWGSEDLISRASLVAQTVKNPPAVQETRVRSLGREDPLEKGMATHSSILAWRSPGTESHVTCGLVRGVTKSQT